MGYYKFQSEVEIAHVMVKFALYTVQCAVCSAHCAICSVRYTGSKATDEKATSSLFVSCLLVGEKVAFLSAQKATMKFSYFAMQQVGYA